MKRWQRRWSRALLLSYCLRALVPLGLMLQLPSALAAGSSEIASDFGFVICPQQNPGIDLSLLTSSASHHHAHHQHGAPENDSQTLEITHATSLCNLWTNSTESTPEPAAFTQYRPTRRAVSITVNNTTSVRNLQFQPQQTRAPPANL